MSVDTPPLRKLNIFHLAAREVTVTTAGVPNVEYIFQTSTDLDIWTSTAVTASATGELTMTVAAPESDAKCFYRYSYAPSE